MKLTPYLFFNGTCETAMRRYAEIFGAEIVGIMKNGDAEPEYRMPGSDDLIMNMMIRFGDCEIYASDSTPDREAVHGGYDIHVEADSLEDGERIFNALADGGAVHMPYAPMFWAERFANLTDKFGVNWMISYTGNAMADMG